jgi:hypothetical protein
LAFFCRNSILLLVDFLDSVVELAGRKTRRKREGKGRRSIIIRK